MKSKSAAGLLVLVFIGIVTWSLTTAVGTTFGGGREQFLDWRADNTTLFYGIWLAEIVLIGLPALWFVGKRMGAYATQQDKAVVEARGVGRLAGRALRGDKKAIDHLIKLLDDKAPAVRYQSARALALLDDKAADEELFRKVRYWDVDHKLGLIDVLRRTMDMRIIKLLRVLSEDRNHVVARKARTGLAIVSSRSGSIDDIVAKRRRQAQAKQKRAKGGGLAPPPSRNATARPEKTAKPAAEATPSPDGDAPVIAEAPAADADARAPADPAD
jgi:hypothetical protein